METANILVIIALAALECGAAVASSHTALSGVRLRRSPEAAHAGKHRGKGRSEAVLIRDYYATRGLPPGLAKRRALPPGLRRQLVVGGRLPPGLQKRLYAVPGELVAVLPRLPHHQRRFFLGVDLLVVDTRRNVVVNIVADVLH